MQPKRFQRALFVVTVSVIILYLILSSLNEDHYREIHKEVHGHIKEFMKPNGHILRNILEDDEELKKANGKLIFFIETRMPGRRSFKSPRPICSVESAARLNPDYRVYLLFATNETDVIIEHSKYIDTLLTYPNVNLRYLNMIEYGTGSVLEQFMKDGVYLKSHFQLEHTSDILRCLTLYKYGGLYLDLDVITVESMYAIGLKNFACVQDTNFVPHSIVQLDTNFGKKIAEKCINKLSTGFNPGGWTSNGPDLFTNIVKELCNNVQINKTEITKCKDFTILPNNYCFPYDYKEFSNFFNESLTQKAMQKMEKSYFVHIWNKAQSWTGKSFDTKLTSKSAFVQMTRTFCPRVFDSLESYI